MKISSSQIETYRRDSKAILVRSGKEYFSALEKLIDEAREEIQFQTYIFEQDETGISVTQSLIRAAERGVKVFLVVDSFGSSGLGNEFARLMNDHNIYFRKFSPFFSQKGFQVGRRLHHKVVVADEQKALIGGINIADKYRGTVEVREWFDLAVLLEGNICKHLSMICNKIERKRFTIQKKDKKKIIQYPTNHHHLIRIRQNDWARSKKQIRLSYKTAIRNAEHSIIIIAAYFIPDATLRRVLRKAARRGVQIKLILSEHSDVPFIKNAHHFLYGWLLHLKIQVFEYRPSVLHAKAMLVDGEWITIGSYNLNHLSDYSSIELNADIFSNDVGSKFTKDINEILENDCREITTQIVSKRSLLIKLKNWLSYQIIRMNMSLLFLFISRKEKNRLE